MKLLNLWLWYEQFSAVPYRIAHTSQKWNESMCEVAAQSSTKIANGTLPNQMNRCEQTTLFLRYELEQQKQQVHAMNSECVLGLVYESCVLASKLKSNWLHSHLFTLHTPHWWLSYCHAHCVEWAHFLLCTSENVKTIELSCNIAKRWMWGKSITST